MTGVNREMTVKEALPFCFPAQAMSVAPWAEMFNIRLCDFQIAQIVTYQTERSLQADLHTVNCEVSIFLDLLQNLGLGEEIRGAYRPLLRPDELSTEEKDGLPERVQQYIQKLENRLSSLEYKNDKISSKLRKAQWARWSR
jgi:hypothetical protein